MSRAKLAGLIRCTATYSPAAYNRADEQGRDMIAERMALSHLIYFSRIDLPADARERSDHLGEILREARRRNESAEITSVLMIEHAFAAQVLEGDDSRIHETFQRIAADKRHRDVLIVE